MGVKETIARSNLVGRKELPLKFNERRKLNTYGEYKDSIGTTGTLPTTALDSYTKASVKSMSGFAKLKAADGKDFAEKFDETKHSDDSISKPAILDVKAKVATALTLSTAPKDLFDSDIKALGGILKKGDAYTPASIAFALEGIKDDAVKGIKSSYTTQKTALENLFKEKPFKDNLKIALNLQSSDEVDDVKKQMVAALTKSQNEQIAAVEKSITTSISSFHKQEQEELYRISFLGDRYKRDKGMRAEIDALAQKNSANANIPVSASVNYDTGNALLKGIKITDLTSITTVTGRSLSINSDGSYSMKFNKYFQWAKVAYQDLASLAETVKACGHASITMSITCKDPVKAAEFGRKAYEAAIIAGFDPKNITIKVQTEGKELVKQGGKSPKDDLFTSHPNRLHAINARAKTYSTAVEARLKTETQQATANLKQEIKNMRPQERPENGVPPAADPNTNNAP